MPLADFQFFARDGELLSKFKYSRIKARESQEETMILNMALKKGFPLP